MKKLSTFQIACLITLLFLTRPTLTVAMEDAIIAVVNDELITLRDLREFIHATYVELVAEGVSDSEMSKIMLDLEINGINKLIEEKLILSKAKTIGIELNDQLVDERLEEIKVKYPSEEIFMEALIRHGATVTDLRNKILHQLMIKYVIEHEVRSKIYINPNEITEYYNQHLNEFQKRERVNLDSIFIPFKDNKDQAISQANEALEKIKSGENFISVAQSYSQTPAVGVVERGQLLPAIEKAVFRLSDNEVSDLVEAENGIYIFQLRGRMEAQTANINEVKSIITRIIFNQKFSTSMAQWLEKLKKEAYIELKK